MKHNIERHSTNLNNLETNILKFKEIKAQGKLLGSKKRKGETEEPQEERQPPTNEQQSKRIRVQETEPQIKPQPPTKKLTAEQKEYKKDIKLKISKIINKPPNEEKLKTKR